MKTTLGPFVLALSLLFPNCVFGQWIQRPFPSTEYLWKLHFVDSNTGWILGSQHLYRTTNAGVTWFPQDTVTTGGGRALYAVNTSMALYAEYVPSTGLPYRGIRKTTDGGLTWRTVDTLRMYYADIEFVDAQIGYAAGSLDGSPNPCVIRKSTDGGDSWFTTAALNAGSDFEAVSFVDHLRGWAISYNCGSMFRTTNGGSTWTYQDSVGKLTDGSTFPMRDVKFTTVDSGWAIGGIAGTSVIARTTDGGTTWTKTDQPGNTLVEIAMVNSRDGWIIGRVYNVPPLRTTNGGESWIEQPTTPPILGFDLSGISMIDQGQGWIVGQGGRVYHTTNGGVVGVDQEDPRLPRMTRLEQNYPNPFNPTTVIEYSLPADAFVTLTTYDLLGRQVAIMESGFQKAGNHSIAFDGSELSSGVYFYNLRSGGLALIRKMVVMK